MFQNFRQLLQFSDQQSQPEYTRIFHIQSTLFHISSKLVRFEFPKWRVTHSVQKLKEIGLVGYLRDSIVEIVASGSLFSFRIVETFVLLWSRREGISLARCATSLRFAISARINNSNRAARVPRRRARWLFRPRGFIASESNARTNASSRRVPCAVCRVPGKEGRTPT